MVGSKKSPKQGKDSTSTNYTPRKIVMEPENAPLEKDTHLQTTDFWIPFT